MIKEMVVILGSGEHDTVKQSMSGSLLAAFTLSGFQNGPMSEPGQFPPQVGTKLQYIDISRNR